VIVLVADWQYCSSWHCYSTYVYNCSLFTVRGFICVRTVHFSMAYRHLFWKHYCHTDSSVTTAICCLFARFKMAKIPNCCTLNRVLKMNQNLFSAKAVAHTFDMVWQLGFWYFSSSVLSNLWSLTVLPFFPTN